MIAPCTHFAPAVQHCHFFYTVRRHTLDIVIKSAEFFTYGSDILYKIRELERQLQIAAISDSLDRTSKDCPSCGYPVDLCLFYRISTFMKGIREEIGKESSFCICYIFDITEKTECCTISHTSYHSIQSNRRKLIHKGLHSDPVVSHEHHGFFPILMNDIYHLFCKFCHFSPLECLEIPEFSGWDSVHIVHIPLIDNKLRTELIAHLFFKLFQNIRAY